jgi:radical SAM superfamily enzyme YgiQ (UPF0313 family)
MSDIVLINAPMIFSRKKPAEGDEVSNPWMGILYLASYVEQDGFSVKIYDPGAERLNLTDIINRLQKDKPFLVGISTLTSGIRSAVELAKRVKKEFGRNIALGIGGSHINVDPTFVERFPIFDFSVIGEGEKTFLQIVNDVKKGKKPKKIYQGEIIPNLDDIPFPARHLINPYNYVPRVREGLTEKPWAAIVGSRGCPFLCSFCSRNPEWRKVRFRSAKNIVDEMENVYKNYDGKFSFTDDAISLNRKITWTMCEEILKRKLPIKWLGMTRVNCVDEKLLELMAKSGCEELFFGVESGNERVRNRVIGKRITEDQIRNAINWCRKFDIRSSIFLMLGFPTETKKEIDDTVSFGAKFDPDFIGVHITIPLPGSKVFEEAKKDKIIDKNLIDKYARGKLGKKGFVGVWPIYIPKGLTAQDLFNARKQTYRKFYLRPKWIWRRILSYLRSIENLKHDLTLIRTGVYVLIHGKTQNAPT